MRLFGYLCLLLTGVIYSGCAENSPVESVKPISAYEAQINMAESVISSGGSVGLVYVHPKHKRACNIMQVRISEQVYNGIEFSWQVFDVIEIKEKMTSPLGRRQIGEYPVLFLMPDAEQARIDAISCTGYDGVEIPQFQIFATFEPQPGQVSYIGDFRQVNLAEKVDIYTVTQEDTVANRLGEDSSILQAKLKPAETEPFTFENYDGSFLDADQVIENKNFGGDYFVLSQTLKTQADEALYPFLPYIPDLKLQLQGPDAKEDLGKALLYNIDLAFLRQDLYEDFNAIIKAGKGFVTARDYIKLKLDRINKARALRNTKNYSRNFEELWDKHQAAKNAHDRFINAKNLKKIVDQNISDERRAARKEFRKQMERMPYVLMTPLSQNADVLARKRIQDIMTDYIPAKYASLKFEFSALSDLANSPLADRRRLRNLIDAAESEEGILLEELIASFMRESLEGNETYHQARARFDRNWEEIIRIRQALSASREQN